MAKTQSLRGDDLVVSTPRNNGSTLQRGSVPSSELVPLQFRMPAEFVQEFKQAALDRRIKLNEMLKVCFQAFMKEVNKK